MSKLIIEGVDGDRSTVIEFDCDRIGEEMPVASQPYTEGVKLGRVTNSQRVVIALNARVIKVSGGFAPDSILGMTARAGRADITRAEVALRPTRAYAVRMRFIGPDGKGEMRTYTAASGERYEADSGFPSKLNIITNKVELDELKQFRQFEIVGISPNDESVDGMLAQVREELVCLKENMDAIRTDADGTIEVSEEVRLKAELFIRMLRAEADALEKELLASAAAMTQEVAGVSK